MILLGLTGGIGMGKSTAAGAFRRARVPVFDADAAVHALQARGGAAVAAIAALRPETLRHGAIDRDALRAAVLADPALLARLEAVLHPLVRAAERRFVQAARRRGCPLAVLDVPLLLETGGEARVDLVLVVSASPAVQAARVQRRRRMSAAEVARLVARQMPDLAKRRRADVVLPTGLSRAHALRRLRRLLALLRARPPRRGTRPVRRGRRRHPGSIPTPNPSRGPA